MPTHDIYHTIITYEYYNIIASGLFSRVRFSWILLHPQTFNLANCLNLHGGIKRIYVYQPSNIAMLPPVMQYELWICYPN